MKKHFYLLIVMVVLLFSLCSCKHIEDTNGPDDYHLTTITDEKICSNNSSVIKVGSSESTLGDSGYFKVNKMSGVENLRTIKVNNQNVEIILSSEVYEGNVRIVLINNKEIINDFELNVSQRINLDNVSGVYYLKVAAESGNFKINYTVTVS